MLSVANVQKSFGARLLFSGVTLTLVPGRRVALVGPNGAGKTTLLEIVMGLQRPDGGTVSRPKDIRVGYLPQDMAEAPDGTVLDNTMAGDEQLHSLAGRLHQLAHLVAETSGADHDPVLAEYGAVQSQFEQLGGYALEAEAQRVLAGLGFSPLDADREVRELSGGWRMRVALAALLLAAPDVLVLDEPTNHLDVDSVAFLEQHLVNFPGALLVVSHDRDFIDMVATRVVDLSEGTSVEYVGGFAEFVVAREERLEAAASAAATQARKVAQTERFIERFRYKATKARQVQSRIKALDRLERIEIPDLPSLKMRFSFPEPRRSSRVVAELDGVAVGYEGIVVLGDVQAVIERGRKVALIGPNGAGKTTLVKLITGQLPALEGAVTLGTNVDLAHFEQHQADELDPARTVFQEFTRNVTERPGRNLRTVLGSFGFPGDAADRRVGDLSGGERTRLALAKVLADPVNLLVLDEPTNHLDLPSCDLLEDALRAYPGTLLLITHDRYLIREVADALIEVRDGRAVWHEGVDESLLSPRRLEPAGMGEHPKGASGARAPEAVRTSAAESTSAPQQPPAVPTSTRTRTAAKGSKGNKKSTERGSDDRSGTATLSNNAERELRKQLARAEKAWEKAEAEVADLERQLADPAVYDNREKVGELAALHADAKDAALSAMTEWESLTRRLERRARR